MARMRAEAGAAAVEFALIASVLLMILFGTAQFGIAFNRMQGIEAAAREGARTASLPDSTINDIATRVRAAVSIVDPAAMTVGCGSLATGQGCIQVTPSGAGGFLPCNLRAGQTVTVEVRYRTAITIPLWKTQGVTMNGKGDFRCE